MTQTRALAKRRIVVSGTAFAVQRDRATSIRLGGVRHSKTAPEMAVGGALRGLGWRIRVENRDLPGSPDLTSRALGRVRPRLLLASPPWVLEGDDTEA